MLHAWYFDYYYNVLYFACDCLVQQCIISLLCLETAGENCWPALQVGNFCTIFVITVVLKLQSREIIRHDNTNLTNLHNDAIAEMEVTMQTVYYLFAAVVALSRTVMHVTDAENCIKWLHSLYGISTAGTHAAEGKLWHHWRMHQNNISIMAVKQWDNACGTAVLCRTSVENRLFIRYEKSAW